MVNMNTEHEEVEDVESSLEKMMLSNLTGFTSEFGEQILFAISEELGHE